MNKIIKVNATEDLLKIYFFKLYSRKGKIDINFDEQMIHSLFISNSIETIKSSDLFDCCKINNRYGDIPLEIPESFYYFEKDELLDISIHNHPFLYTNIKTINNSTLFKAEINLQGSGIDIYDENNTFLELSLYANLYDDGYIDIEYLAQNIFSVIYWDENNGEGYDLFLFKNNRFYSISPYGSLVIDNKETILQLLSIENCPPILMSASKNLQADKEVVLAAVRQNGKELQWASDELINDIEIVLAAVKNDKSAIAFASDNFKNDKDFLMLNSLKTHSKEESENNEFDNLPF